MGKKVLYEKLKSLDGGVWIGERSSVSWEDYLPSDIETVVEDWSPLRDDPGSSAGFEIYYSPKYDEFYLREWRHEFATNSGNRVTIVNKETVINYIIREQVIGKLSDEWKKELGFEEEI
ncbi:MAG: hypothetical protein WC276_06940 [Sedimentibacter sp.]